MSLLHERQHDVSRSFYVKQSLERLKTNLNCNYICSIHNELSSVVCVNSTESAASDMEQQTIMYIHKYGMCGEKPSHTVGGKFVFLSTMNMHANI